MTQARRRLEREAVIFANVMFILTRKYFSRRKANVKQFPIKNLWTEVAKGNESWIKNSNPMQALWLTRFTIFAVFSNRCIFKFLQLFSLFCLIMMLLCHSTGFNMCTDQITSCLKNKMSHCIFTFFIISVKNKYISVVYSDHVLVNSPGHITSFYQQ